MGEYFRKLVLLLLCTGILLIHIPVGNLSYGVNEFKINIFCFFIFGVTLLSLAIDLVYPVKTNVNLKGVSLFLIATIILNSINSAFRQGFLMSDLFLLWIPILFYFILNYHFELFNEELLAKITLSIVSTGLAFQLMAGLYQLTGLNESYNKFFAVTGTFSNPSTYAVVLGSHMAFIFFFCSYGKLTLRVRLFLLLLLCLGLYFQVFLLSRSSLLALFCLFILFCIIKYKKVSNFIKSNYFASAIVFASLFLVLIFLYAVKKESSSGRLVIWKIGIPLIKENILFGVGFNRFSGTYNLAQASYFERNQEKVSTEGVYTDFARTANSDFYQVIVEQGIIGLFLFSLITAYVLWSGTRFLKSLERKAAIDNCDQMYLGAYACLVFILVAALFSDPFEQISSRLLFYFFLALIVSKQDNEVSLRRFNGNKPARPVINSRVYFLCVFLFLGLINSHALKRHKFLQNINYAKPDLGDSKRYSYMLNHEYFVLTMGDHLIRTGQISYAVEFLTKAIKHISHWKSYMALGTAYFELKNFNLAEKNFLIAHFMVPHLIYPKFMLAKTYLESNKLDKFIQMAHKILTDKEKVPGDEIEVMRDEIRWLLANKVK